MKISIIIPTYNEANHIGSTVLKLREMLGAESFELIVADGGSTDGTISVAEAAGAAALLSEKKGRAAQMNAGALRAKSDLFYFLHADTLPPPNFFSDIKSSLDQGYDAGCFMLSFDHAHWFLKANCWFTRFDINAIRFGDQSLFVTKSAFVQAGGFSERHIVMEDQDLIRRLRKYVRFTVIKKPVLTSARKYLDNGIYRTQSIFFLIYFLYVLGISQDQLVKTYRRLIRQNKV